MGELADDSNRFLFVSPSQGSIVPNETGSNLFQDTGAVLGKVVNLCGLWIFDYQRLFEWRQIHHCLTSVWVVSFLYETVRRLGLNVSAIPDLTSPYRANGTHLFYEADGDAFTVSFDTTLSDSAMIYPSFSNSPQTDDTSRLSEYWEVASDSQSLKEWLSESTFFSQDFSWVDYLWESAQLGRIEVSGRYPTALSERRVLEPDCFFTAGSLIAGDCKIIIGDCTVWGVEIRISESLAIEGMLEQYQEERLSSVLRKQISVSRLELWLCEFKESTGQKATRDEAVASLKYEFTSTSIRRAYAKQPKTIARDRSERR